MQLMPAPCRISTPQSYGGMPSRGTPPSTESPRMAIRCAFSSVDSLEMRSATRCGSGSEWLQKGSELELWVGLQACELGLAGAGADAHAASWISSGTMAAVLQLPSRGSSYS